MRKLLLIFAALCCMMVANAQQFTYANGIKYNVTSEDDKTVEVIANNNSGAVVIPATVTYNEVTYRVTRIGDHAFDDCGDLVSVILPDGLECIGVSAFDGCTSLSSINIPSSVTALRSYAFYDCSSLASITLPGSITVVEYAAFKNCAGLASVTLQDGITIIGEYAFNKCIKLTSITLPCSVTSIGYNAFGNCESLASVTLQYGIKSIGEQAFIECGKLASITIPSSVTSIGAYAFCECSGLESLTVLASTPPTLGDDIDEVFKYVDTTIPVYVVDVPAYRDKWGYFINFQSININKRISDALTEINAAKEGVSLSDEEVAALNACITAIEGATTLSDENLTLIENKKKEALAVISQAAIRPVREAALFAIEAAMQGETGAYLNGLVQEYIDIINAAADVTVINIAKDTALAVLNAAKTAYKAGEAEALGTLGTKQNGPSLIVTDKDDKEFILYNPKSVEYIKINDK